VSARAAILGCLICTLAACSSAPLREILQPSPGRPALTSGLDQYEDGQFGEAARNFQAALEKGLTDREKADAHKHLAFIQCSWGNERLCREEFRRALGAQPDLTLSPAEAGHPAWGPVFASLKPVPLASLAVGLRQYEDGDYAESAKNLQNALNAGLSGKDGARAHKHLAFIHCVSNRERQCREEFRRALAEDPGLELAPAEAGHPVWGPVFRAVKAGH